MIHDIKKLRGLISSELALLDFKQEPRELYDPIEYTLSLGGKRMRPALVLMACELFGGDVKRAIKPALGIEMFHNFTLLHDDIMDKAPLRRNKQTVHEKWNTNIAILSGDAMFVKSYDLIADCDPTILKTVLDKFNRCALKVCEGQQLDLNFENSGGFHPRLHAHDRIENGGTVGSQSFYRRDYRWSIRRRG